MKTILQKLYELLAKLLPLVESQKKQEVIDNVPITIPKINPGMLPIIKIWTPVNEWDIQNRSKKFGDYPLDKKKKLYTMARQICLDKNLSPQMTAELLATIWGESSYNPFCQNENRRKDGTVASTDFGVAQLNDFYFLKPLNITGEQAMLNPKFCIEIMADNFLQGHADYWVAHKNKSYLSYMGKVV